MSRIAALAAHPVRTLATLTVALGAVGVAVGTGASFSSTSTDTAKTFTAGVLHHVNTATGALVSGTVANVRPGFGTLTGGVAADIAAPVGDTHGRVVLTNDGTLPGDFTVTATKSGTAYAGTTPVPAEICGGTCSPLDAALKVRVTKTDAGDTAAVSLYDGLVRDLTAAQLGTAGTGNTFTLAAGATRTYDVYFYLPTATGNAFQGGSASIGLSFNQVQQ